MMNTSYGLPCALCDGLPCRAFMLEGSPGTAKGFSKLVVFVFDILANTWLKLLDFKVLTCPVGISSALL